MEIKTKYRWMEFVKQSNIWCCFVGSQSFKNREIGFVYFSESFEAHYFHLYEKYDFNAYEHRTIADFLSQLNKAKKEGDK